MYLARSWYIWVSPSAETLAEIALESARVVRGFNIEPRVAMLSFSNFGSARHPDANRVHWPHSHGHEKICTRTPARF